MQDCELVTLISIIACSIAKGKTQDELNILAAIFSQLRRYINNISYSGYKQGVIISEPIYYNSYLELYFYNTQ